MNANTCPDVERWAQLAGGELSDDDRWPLEEHARACPLCRVELDLAREFALPAAATTTAAPGEASDVAFVVASLETRFGSTPEGRTVDSAPRNVVAFPPSRTWARRYAPLAAAAVLILAVGFWGRSEMPGLPDPQDGGALRAGAVEVEGPVGEVPGGPLDAPLSFAWRPVPGAAAYRLTLRDVTDRVLWSEQRAVDAGVPVAEGREVTELPPSVRLALSDRTRYRWRIEALGASGDPIRESPWIDFRWTGRP